MYPTRIQPIDYLGMWHKLAPKKRVCFISKFEHKNGLSISVGATCFFRVAGVNREHSTQYSVAADPFGIPNKTSEVSRDLFFHSPQPTGNNVMWYTKMISQL